MNDMDKDQVQSSLTEQDKDVSPEMKETIDINAQNETKQESGAFAMPKKGQTPKLNGASALNQFVLMVVLASAIGFISAFIPVLWLVAILFFPIPIAILVLRHNLLVGFIGLIFTFIILSLMVGMPSALSTILQSGFLGIFFGYCFARKSRPIYVLLGGTIIAAAGTAASIIISTVIAGLPISSLMNEFYNTINLYFDTLSKSSSYQQILPNGTTLADYQDYFIAFIKKILPGAFVISSMFMALLNYLISKKILANMGYSIPSLPAFSLWRLDWRFAWGVIIGLALWFIGQKSDISLLDMIGTNIIYILVPVLLVCGLSFLVWLLKYWQASNIFKIIIVIILINFFQYTLFLLIFMGLFDPLFDFRKKLSSKNQ